MRAHSSTSSSEKGGEYERSLAIIYLLFGEEGLSDFKNHTQLLELGKKYLSCGKDLENSDSKDKDMDFKQDMDYIETSFMSDYQIDLSKIKMHWWTFFKLLNGLSNSELGNCCILNRIRNLRNFDLKDIKDIKEREKILKAKEQVALKKEVKLTKEQQKSVDEFYKSIGF